MYVVDEETEGRVPETAPVDVLRVSQEGHVPDLLNVAGTLVVAVYV